MILIFELSSFVAHDSIDTFLQTIEEFVLLGLFWTDFWAGPGDKANLNMSSVELQGAYLT